MSEIQVKSITTKFGTSLINDGYWTISNGSKTNHKKKLHRLLFEDFHKCTLLPNAIIHHKDGNKLNNRITNLELMDRVKHVKLHHIGVKRTEEMKKNMSKGRKGIPCSDEQKLKVSNVVNSTGFFRVTTNNCNTCKKGFIWLYQYYIDGKQKLIRSTNLIRLKQKVLSNGLDWKVVNEDNALLTCKTHNYKLSELV